MSPLSLMLLEKAEEIRLSSPEEVAIEHLKQAGFSDADARLSVAQHVMEKEAIQSLTHAGIDVERAVSMVKAAGINLKDLVSYEPEVAEIHQSVELIKQAALYINDQEALIAELQATIEKNANQSLLQEVKLPDSITKVAGISSFTNEDLLELQKINPEVMTKLANAMDEPWGMGKAAGMVRPKTDPMLEFLIG